ncbi:MAG: response regulator [Cyanosarcina radialis HA8281-LM2]|jgi:signal transduction histidine kinase/DNA-binding response OmpR family regulator|nr:response regulator [Cyanosarcina radialis HA8281-LM2]
MSEQQRTILIVDDSPEDRELYRRYLLRDCEYRYTILEATLGQQGLELWQQHQPDVVLLDYRLPDGDGLEWLDRMSTQKQQPCLPVIVVTGQGSEALAVRSIKAGAQDYLVKGQITPEGLQLAVNGAIATVQLRAQLQQRIEIERLVAQMTRQIHQSLKLDRILQTTVDEVRQFLQCDRVFIYRFRSDFSGIVVVESVGDNWLSIVDVQVEDRYFMQTRGEEYRRGRIQAVADVRAAGLSKCHVDLLSQFQIAANLVVPILHGEGLWGLLVANQCAAPRQWQPLEIELVQQLSTQVGIAIQQAELYQQARAELSERQQTEIERDRLFAQEQSAREEAERANRVKDEFLAVLSHELRSPLNPILGWVKLLQTSQLDEAQTKEALNTIERNAKLQTQLIDDLLDVAKILRGKLNLNAAPVNLGSIVESAMETVRTSADAKSIALHAVLPDIGLVSGDAVRLQQIVWNLLSNAIKFSPSGGRVEIELERVEAGRGGEGERGSRGEEHSLCPMPHAPCPMPYGQLTVRDMGKGISREFLPHIFEYFRQEDASITRQHGGLGLGLAIVRYLVESHGGTIAAASCGEGQGATFTVRLPLVAVVDESNRSPDSLARKLDLTGIRVLLVDDEPDTRQMLSFVFREYGAESMAAASGNEGLTLLESFQPHILVSDIGMPEMDGYTLMKRVRSLPPERGGQIRAIALTAYAREEDRQKAASAGFQEHISKPVELEKLVRAVFDLARQPEIP